MATSRSRKDKPIAIREAARKLFLEQGFRETNMDQIAAQAEVSKQTIYQHFADKEALFKDLIEGISAKVEVFLEDLRTFQDSDNLEADLLSLARRYTSVVFRPDVFQLRWLVIREVQRFPQEAKTYYEKAPRQTLAELARRFQTWSDKGTLTLVNAEQAAEHFSALVLMMPLDRALFGQIPTPQEIETNCQTGVKAFCQLYKKP